MIPLNEYPKEELEELLCMITTAQRGLVVDRQKWLTRVREAISDQDFKEKELPFKTEDNESREFEL